MRLSTFYKFPFKLFELGVEWEFLYGKEQKKIVGAVAEYNVRAFLKPISGSILHIMSYNFPKSEWNNREWTGWLKEQKVKGVRIKVVGGPDIKAKETLEQLVREGVIEVKMLDKPLETHFIFVDNPRQLLIEGYHRDKYARGCFFTDKPYEETWQNVQKIFDELWILGKNFS